MVSADNESMYNAKLHEKEFFQLVLDLEKSESKFGLLFLKKPYISKFYFCPWHLLNGGHPVKAISSWI
jgi:hypothetical protein